jgi:hypothetical protein
VGLEAQLVALLAHQHTDAHKVREVRRGQFLFRLDRNGHLRHFSFQD